jgi:NAD-dependent DNA ligase
MIKKRTDIKRSIEKRLHDKCGNLCPICNCNLSTKNISIGETAHIYGLRLNSARYDPQISEEFLNTEENLILVCCSCHKIIDTDVIHYTSEVLMKIKAVHENNVNNSIKAYVVNSNNKLFDKIRVRFTKRQHQISISTDLRLLALNKKIEKNKLEKYIPEIRDAMAQAASFEKYLNTQPSPNLGEIISTSLVEKYHSLLEEENDQYIIFSSLWDFSSNYSYDSEDRASGIIALVYIFEKCDIFKK